MVVYEEAARPVFYGCLLLRLVDGVDLCNEGNTTTRPKIID